MLSWFWRGKIRNSLLIGFFVLALTLGLVASAVGYRYATSSVTDLAIENLKNLADAQVEFIETWFFERSNFIRHLASEEEIKSLHPPVIWPELEKAQKAQPDFLGLVVTDSRGVTIAGAYVPPGVDLSQRSYIKDALNGYESISEVMISPLDQKPVVALASPIKNNDWVVGVVLGIIDIERINKEVVRGYHGRTGEVFLVNRDGLMVTESRFTADLVAKGVVINKTSMELKVNTRDVEEALRGNSGSGRFKDYRGVEVISLYRWVPSAKMAIVAKKDLSEIAGEARTATQTGVAAAILVAMLFLPVVLVIIRKLSQPLEVLAEGADKIAGGNYGYTLSLNSSREIATLANSFNRMSRELKEQHEALLKQIALLEDQKHQVAVRNEELAEANARLELIAITDQLTGAYNRRYIISQLQQELATSIRHGLPLSIIMIDIDHFKSINDTHGHQVGDEVLKEMVQVLSRSLRASDILGRYGGEEFIVIAPLTGIHEALILAERLRETVYKWPFETTYGYLKLTISLGVATFGGKAEFYQKSMIDRLLAQADAEMYRAKGLGRNRVCPSLAEIEKGAAASSIASTTS